MRRTNTFTLGLRTLALTTVCAGLVTVVSAADPQSPVSTDTHAAGVALHEGGVLHGQVVDARKHPVAKQTVRILSQGRLILATETDAQGRFGARSLRGGLHTIESPGSRQTVQLWAPHTAPPSASQIALIQDGQGRVARGQDDEDEYYYDESGVRRRKLIAFGVGAGVLAWALDYNKSGS